MDLFIQTASNHPANEVTSLVANYFGLVKDQKVFIQLATQEQSQVPFLRLPNGTSITQAAVITKYLASLARRDIAESLCPSNEQPAIDRWLSLAAEKNYRCGDPSFLSLVDAHLSTRSFFVTQHITVADLVMFGSLHAWMVSTSPRERLAFLHITRWYNHIQNLPGIYGVKNIPIPFVDPGIPECPPLPEVVLPHAVSSAAPQALEAVKMKPQKEKKVKQAKNADNNSVKNTEIKDKQKAESSPKKQVAAAVDERLIGDVTRLEIRVGLILEASNHPEADKLYCEKIDIGEPQPRQIASGLREHITLDEFQGQKVLVLCNMKEKKLRGFGSHGMILCGKKIGIDGKEKVELVKPPPDAMIGERVLIDGLSGEPDVVMSTKAGKDPFVAVQPDFIVNDDGVACYKLHKFRTSAGDCICDTIRGGSIS